MENRMVAPLVMLGKQCASKSNRDHELSDLA